MSGQHTQGRVYTVERHGIAYLLKHGAEVRSDVVDISDVVAANLTPADARRLAACWNACIGAETEAIEKLAGAGGVVAGANACIKVILSLASVRADVAEIEMHMGTVKDLTAERDQLLAELAAARALLAEVGDRIEAEDGASILKDEVQRIRELLAYNTIDMGDNLGTIHYAASQLAVLAEALNLVLTITQRPRLPLAMGSYDTVVEVRPARVMAEKGGAA